MRVISVLFAIGVITHPVMASQHGNLQPSACTEIRASIQRLACFDQLFQTPAYIETIAVPQEHRPNYGIIEAVNAHEQLRQKNDYSLRVTSDLEHPAAEQHRVIISVPAIGAIGTRPVFALSCIDNITRLQLILPDPIPTTRLDIRIKNENGKILLDDQWKIIGGGHIVDAGHGIPSIRVAKKLLGAKRLIFTSGQEVIDGVTFDVAAMPEQILPLQTACHWSGAVSRALLPRRLRHD